MKRTATISDIIQPLDSTPYQCYMSNAIQVADVLEYALAFTGPADVTMTSFSISEEFLRRLFFIRKKGNVRSLRIVLDYKATNKTLLLWPFIAQTVERCFLADNHSKILLIRGDSAMVAVVTSQNLTRGNRYECASIVTDPACCANIAAQLEEVIKSQSVPFHDIYRQRVATD